MGMNGFSSARARRGMLAAMLAAGLGLASSEASAGELSVVSGPTAGATSWRTDVFVTQGLRLGYRPTPRLVFDVATSLGYATVDRRMTAGIGLGATLFVLPGAVRPFLRLGLQHQHEEPASNVREDPLETLSAVGPDVRHRSAGVASLGVELAALRVRSSEILFALEGASTWFVDDRGPSVYAGGGLWLGLHHGI